VNDFVLVFIGGGGKNKVYEENHEVSTEAVVHLMDQLDLEASTECMDGLISANERGKVLQINGARPSGKGPGALISTYVFSFSVTSLFVDCES
jgi:hypothetical protein